MGLFGGDFEGPRLGVDLNAPEKRGFFKFFEIFIRKFWHFLKVNTIYSLFALPAFIILVPVLFYIVSSVVQGVDLSAFGNESGSAFFYICIFATLMLVNFFSSMMGMGPASAGATYIYRNFAGENHAFLWTDFVANVKKNLKQSIFVFLTDIASVIVVYFAILVYSGMDGVLGYIKYLVIALYFVFILMHIYIYPLMVSFDMSIKDIYKNALLFTFGKFPHSLLLFIALLALHVILPAVIMLYAGMVSVIIVSVILFLNVFITQAFSGFMVNFVVYPKIKKFM